MNKIYSALVQPRYHQLRYAIAILIGYSVGGFYLSSCQATSTVWSIIHLLIAYIATTGTGGIVVSEACFSSLIVSYAFSHPWPVTNVLSIPFTPAQIWSSTLLTFWLLGSLLITLLGTAVTASAQRQRFHWQHALSLGSLSGLALHLGHRVHTTLAM